MLGALRNAGFDALGYDIAPTQYRYVTDLLPTFKNDLETLISVVRDVDQTEDVLFGKQAFCEAPNLRRIIICSTLSPVYTRALVARVPNHITLIDAPMSGAQIAATEARLSFMLGGDKGALDAAQPLFDAMGKHFHRMGVFGSGMQAKVLNNLLAASNTAMTRLVLEWACEAELDKTALLNLIATSSGQNWFASGFEDIEFARDGYAPDNSIGILVKDIASALDAAPEGCNTELPEIIQKQLLNLHPSP